MISRKLLLKVSLAVFLLFLFSAFFYFRSIKDKDLKVIFFDVGQGDSSLVRTPAGNNILIDGGPDSTALYKLGKYLPIYGRTIDLMILTHPHSDHVAGLIPILEKYKVKQILSAGVVHTSPDYLKWLELIKKKKINFIKADGYRQIVFPSGGKSSNDVKLDVLYPFEDISKNSFKDLNESSVVVKLTYGKSSFLLMGDLPIEGEDRLIKQSVDLLANVLKVGHHGSKFSSSPEFLAQVRPSFAVISSGKNNDFGHPHFRTLKNLDKIGAKILRTDEIGDIIFESNGAIVKNP